MFLVDFEHHETIDTYMTLMLLCPDCLMKGLKVNLGDLVDVAHSTGVSCLSCGEFLQVIDGIPILVPKELTTANNFPENAVSREHLEYETETTIRVARLLSENQRDLSLDAGCGKGVYADSFGPNVVLLDANFFFVSEAIKRCNRPNSCHGIVADVRCLPFATGTFDLVFCSNVIEHLQPSDGLMAIEEMKRTTREVLQIDVPNERGLVRLLKSTMTRSGIYKASCYNDESLSHKTEFSPETLRRLGFKVTGCIGWVTRKRIPIDLLWSIYDIVVWRLPYIAGTLIGVWRKPVEES